MHLGFAGELREVRTYQRSPRRLLEVQEFGVQRRSHETYRLGRKIKQRQWFEVPIPERPILMIVEEFSPEGKVLRRKQEWIDRRGNALATRSSCVSAVTPVTVSPHGIPGIMAHAFDNLGGGAATATSSDSIRFRFEDCGGTAAPSPEQQRLMLSSVEEGLRCMMDPRRGGAGHPSRGQADAGLLIAMLARPSHPFTVRCATERGLNGNLGMATLCPSMMASLGEDPLGYPPFPGISIATDVSVSRTVERTSFKRTFFHEMLHTLGYPHGHVPEVSYSCEKCCFPDSRASAVTRAACRLCSTPDEPGNLTEDYVVDFLRVNASLSNSTSVVNLANRILEQGGAADLGRFANRILGEFCPSHNFANETECDPDVMKVYAILAGIRARLQTPTTEERRLLVEVSREARDDARVFSNNTIIFLTERSRGRSPESARTAALDFFRTYECPRLAAGSEDPSDPEQVAAGLRESFNGVGNIIREDSTGNPSLVFPGIRDGGTSWTSLGNICSGH